jgi:hypothetical protein
MDHYSKGLARLGVTNTNLLVCLGGLGTQVVFLYLARPSSFLPSLDLLSWFNDTSIDSL